MVNQPLSHYDVAHLPLGYNITGYFPNRRMRRAILQNRSSTPKRSELQIVKDSVGRFVKSIFKKP